MGRTKVEVNVGELSHAIQTAEANGPFSTRQELAIAIADSEWAKKNNITTSVVISRIAEFGLTPKTPKGKRGRQSGQVLSQDHKDKLLAGRGKKKVDEKWIKEMRRVTPTAYFPIIDKIESGSLKSQLKLMCLFCTNFNKSEVKNCTINSCPLYAGRPYQVNAKGD
jgi:hypothetical protein